MTLYSHISFCSDHDVVIFVPFFYLDSHVVAVDARQGEMVADRSLGLKVGDFVVTFLHAAAEDDGDHGENYDEREQQRQHARERAKAQHHLICKHTTRTGVMINCVRHITHTGVTMNCVRHTTHTGVMMNCVGHTTHKCVMMNCVIHSTHK